MRAMVRLNAGLKITAFTVFAKDCHISWSPLTSLALWASCVIKFRSYVTIYSNTCFYSLITLLPSFMKLSPNSLILSSVLLFVFFFFSVFHFCSIPMLYPLWKQWKQRETLFLVAPKSLQMVAAAMKLKDTPWKKSYDQPRQHIKKQRHYFANKGLSSQGYGFSSSQMWMWELHYKESWAPKNWCFWTVVLEKTIESPLDCKEIQLVHPKGNQSWIFIGKIDAEAETPVLWPPHVKNWLVWKRPWCWERLKAGGEGDDRGWNGWMASSI